MILLLACRPLDCHAAGKVIACVMSSDQPRYREAHQASDIWLKHQRRKILRALAAFEAAPPNPAATDIVAIGLSCALSYLDWRKAVDWRPQFPRLVAWLDAFASHEPAFDATRAPRT